MKQMKKSTWTWAWAIIAALVILLGVWVLSWGNGEPEEVIEVPTVPVSPAETTDG